VTKTHHVLDAHGAQLIKEIIVSTKLRLAAFAATMTAPFAALAFENTYVPAEKIPYAIEAPGQPQQLGPLWGKRAEGPAGTLLKVPAGFRAPIHAHTADYRAVVIEGQWTHWVPETGEGKGIELSPGSYWTQKADQMHADACVSETSCVILLINDDPYRTYLPK
jgi:quercetin dioxygenase-like cupin family protein